MIDAQEERDAIVHSPRFIAIQIDSGCDLAVCVDILDDNCECRHDYQRQIAHLKSEGQE